MKKQQTGFTLIELMIAIAIIGIISSVALSNYSSNVISANRTDGRATLLETSTALEKCKAVYGTYTNNCSITAATVVTSKEGLYTITPTSLSASAFTLTASPVTGLKQAEDTECTTITLNNLGVQSGTGTAITECW